MLLQIEIKVIPIQFCIKISFATPIVIIQSLQSKISILSILLYIIKNLIIIIFLTIYSYTLSIYKNNYDNNDLFLYIFLFHL